MLWEEVLRIPGMKEGWYGRAEMERDMGGAFFCSCSSHFPQLGHLQGHREIQMRNRKAEPTHLIFDYIFTYFNEFMNTKKFRINSSSHGRSILTPTLAFTYLTPIFPIPEQLTRNLFAVSWVLVTHF